MSSLNDKSIHTNIDKSRKILIKMSQDMSQNIIFWETLHELTLINNDPRPVD